MLRDEIKNYKSRGGATETIPAECPYCHQIIAVEVMPDMVNDVKKLKEIAIETCKCPEAQFDRKHKERIEKLEEEISYSVGKFSDNPLSEDICDSIQQMARLVCFKRIQKATINLSKKEKVNLKIDSKGNLIIERESKSVKSRTV